jgi:hypothetical protein
MKIKVGDVSLLGGAIKCRSVSLSLIMTVPDRKGSDQAFLQQFRLRRVVSNG